MSTRATSTTHPRFLLYSHDGMGLGHTRRNLAIAGALAELCPRASILLASGSDETHRLGLPPRVEVLKLPGLRKSGNGEYLSRRLPVNTNEIRHLRSSILEATVKSFQPGVVLVDKHPFGARGEFRAGLEVLKDYGGRAVLGLRDILDEPSVVRREWSKYQLQERIAEFYDRVFVYGERSVLDPVAEYGLPDSVMERTLFCGYVVNPDRPEPGSETPHELSRRTHGRPVVIATAGGGEDGFTLLENFIEATTVSAWHGIVIAGPMTPERDLNDLRGKAAGASVALHSFLPRLPALFRSIDALVCMGGYNTLAEAAWHAVPTVCVPRVAPRAEQLIRARSFQRLGILHLVHPRDSNPASLRKAIRAALATPRAQVRENVAAALNFDGARNAAQELLSLAGAPVPTGEALGVFPH